MAGQSRTMKLSVALFFAGLFGALAAVLILLSFGTDYWLLVSESCLRSPAGTVGPGGVTEEVGVGLQTAADQGGSADSQPSLALTTLNISYHVFLGWKMLIL